MPVGFSSEVRVINPPPQHGSIISGPQITKITRQSGKQSRSPKGNSQGRKRKTKVNVAKKSKRASQKKRGRKTRRS